MKSTAVNYILSISFLFSAFFPNYAFSSGLSSPEDPNLKRAYAGTAASSPPVVPSQLYIGTGEPDEDDVGSEDDLDAIEAGAVCLEPECLSDVNFEIFKRGQIEDLYTLSAATIQKAFEKYSNSPQITSLISHARENLRTNPGRYIQRRPGKKAKAFCYRAVKDALRESGLVTKVFQGSANAYAGVRDLQPMGFENLLDDANLREILQNNPRLAPKGAILVFETTPGARVSPSGHIEIKTQDSGRDGYISISESTKPTYGYRIPQQRRLIGVLYKKDLN